MSSTPHPYTLYDSNTAYKCSKCGFWFDISEPSATDCLKCDAPHCGDESCTKKFNYEKKKGCK